MEKYDTYLRKHDSKLLYGIAVLSMLYHHLFCVPERLNNDFIFSLGFISDDISIKLAWYCKLCVAIFAFLSGYGLFLTASKYENTNILQKIFNDYKYISKHLISFFKKYWIVFIVFIPIRFIFFGCEFDFKEFFWNLVGVDCSYNGEWWYVFLYMKLLFVFPFINCILYSYKNKKSNVLKYAFILIYVCTLILFFRYTVVKNFILNIIDGKLYYYYTFIIGIVIARFSLFDKLKRIVKSNVNGVMMSFVSVILTIIFRTIFAKDAAYDKIDFLIAPILIFSFSNILRYISNKRIDRLFILFGNYSTYIWLVHTFLCYYYFQNIILMPKYSLLIYIWLVILSLSVSIILDYIYNLIGRAISFVFSTKEKLVDN